MQLPSEYTCSGMQANQRGGVLYYSFPSLDAYADRLVHGFSTRIGGVSSGPFARMNLGFSTGDDRDCVRDNFLAFGKALGIDSKRIVISQQTHGTVIREVTEADAGKGVIRRRDYHDIDGLITRVPNLPILTHHADCAVLFFYAPEHRIIGLAHAGWRGTVKGISKKMVERFAAYGCPPEELIIGISPCAGNCCYEIGEDVAENVRTHTGNDPSVLKPIGVGKYLLDLPRLNRLILNSCNIADEQITSADLCTICHPEIFHSHRRTGLPRGIMAAVMMLK